MDYGSLIERSFRMAWRYKSLWVLGLFASFGSTNFGYSDARLKTAPPESLTDPSAIFHEIAPFLAVIFWLALMMLIAYCITKPALIDAVNRIARGGVYRFADSFSTGVSMFFRFFGLTIVSIVVMSAAVMAIVFILLLVMAISPVLAILLLLPAIPAIIVIVWIYVSVLELAERALVVRDARIADSIIEGWTLFRANLGRTAVMLLIYIGLSIGLAIIAGICMLILGAPITAAVLAFNLPLLPALIAGFIMVLPLAIIIGGFVGAAMTALYTLFYFDLVEPGAVHTDVYPEATTTV